MDGFESIVSAIFEHQQYWVRRNLRLKLPIEKRNTPQSPRPELDIVAYSPEAQELLVVECKSWLNSGGVKLRHFENAGPGAKKRYRLFLNEQYWKAVHERIINELNLGAVRPEVKRCLVAGNVPSADLPKLNEYFSLKGWVFHGPDWVCDGLKSFQDCPYQNDAVVMAVKLLNRENKSTRRSGD